jgi:hypothetical protein
LTLWFWTSTSINFSIQIVTFNFFFNNFLLFWLLTDNIPSYCTICWLLFYFFFLNLFLLCFWTSIPINFSIWIITFYFFSNDNFLLLFLTLSNNNIIWIYFIHFYRIIIILTSFVNNFYLIFFVSNYINCYLKNIENIYLWVIALFCNMFSFI